MKNMCLQYISHQRIDVYDEGETSLTVNINKK